MTAPEVFQVRDGDGWEVYVGNASGGWRLVSAEGGTAVVDTLPDGAVAMVSGDPATPEALLFGAGVVDAANRGLSLVGDKPWSASGLRMRADYLAEGGDHRG